MRNKVMISLFLIFTLMNMNTLAMAWLFQSAEEKLRVAEVMYEERNRPLRAQVLLGEARTRYEKKGDIVGLAYTDRAYAYFLVSPAVGRWSRIKFYDKLVNHNNRFIKAIEYLYKALEVFEKYGLYADASNVYFNMAAIYHDKLGENKPACKSLEKSLISHTRYQEENLEEEIELLPGYNSFKDVIEEAQKEANCFVQ